MFTRLYISMIIALCASILLTTQFLQSYLDKDAIEDFVRDTSYAYQHIQQMWQEESLTAKTYFEDTQSPKPYFHFDLMWLQKWDKQSPCDECRYLSSIKNIPVYENNDGMLFSVYPIPDSENVLVISDRQPLDIVETEESMWYQDVEDLLPIIIFGIALSVIGGVLYYPTRQLHKEIDALIRTQRLFGQGFLHTRAEEDIPDPLNDLAINFNAMAEEIGNKVKEGLVFAQAVPHEMRTPLSRIQLASGLLRKSCNEKKQIELLDNIDTYIDDLDELTAQVVAYSRLNSTHIAKETKQEQSIALKDFILSRISVLQHHSGINIQLEIDEYSKLVCNPIHLRLLVDNLLKNALQYTQSRIVILEKSIEGQQILTVEDDGPGIPKEQRKYIFVPFARLDKSRDRKTGGLGLGLAIASAAATNLNGTLTVTNGEFGGAKFVLTRTTSHH